MEPVRAVAGRMAPLDRANVDTDQIIPKQFLKSIKRTDFEAGLFYDWRKAPDFVLDRPEHKGAVVLVTGANFGCGSSREIAPIAIRGSGISVVVADSFARIFFRNSINIGFPILQSPAAAEAIKEGDELEIDLDAGVIRNFTQGDEYRCDSFPPFMNELIKMGRLTEDDADNFQHKNVITRALGMADLTSIDVTPVELEAGDVCLLCSDGLTGMVSDARIAEVLARDGDLQATSRALIDEAIANGGVDNVTVALERYTP